MPEVTHAEHAPFLCAKPGVEALKKSIRNDALDRVVVASCSPHMHEAVFREAVGEAGINPYLMEYVNIREHCSWVHHDKAEATLKAVDLVRGGVYRTRLLEPLETERRRLNENVLVIGGGVAGITSALQLADVGHHVVMLERGPSIGGHMAQLSKTFPTLDCAPCILGPRMAEVAKHENIALLTNATVEAVSGQVGAFHVRIRHSPRGVDAQKCIGCGRCAEKCPITVPNEFDLGLYSRKAIYKPFPEAVPPVYVIDNSSCKRCGLCVKVCPAAAIDLNEEGRTSEHDFGAVVVATGFDLTDIGASKNFQVNENVLTALQMERLAIRELAAGNILKRKDGQRVRRVAYVLCFGSRDPHKGVPYCSGICCAYSIKQAVLIKKTLPYVQVWVYYNDMRMNGRGFEEFYSEARELGVRFIHGKPDGVTATTNGELQLLAEDKDSGLLLDNRVDMVVLATAMVPASGTAELAKTLGVSLGEDKFIAEKHPKMAPVATQKLGIFAAGTALGPKDVRGSVADGQAAAGEVLRLLSRGEISLSPVKPIVDVERCTGCGECIASCPSVAIALASGKAVVDKASCDGCGICVSSCLREALDLAFYGRKQLEAQIKGLLEGKREEIRVLGFFGDEIAYGALDAAGTARLSYPSTILAVRVPSTALIDLKLMLHAFASGADGIMLFDTDGSRQGKATEERLKAIRRSLKSAGIDEGRVVFQPILLPLFRVIGQQIDTYVRKIEKLGKIEGKELGKNVSETCVG
jgi:heterodisulfide reductase subunit A